MSDSFADLWSSSAPIPPKQKPQTLASASASSRPVSSASTSSRPDVFSLLASTNPTSGGQQRYGSSSSLGIHGSGARSSTPNSRPISALGGPAINGRSGSSTPAPVIASSTSQKGGSDAFSDLFASSSVSGANGHGGMTLAARLEMEARQKARGGLGGQTKTTTNTQDSGLDAWAGLDALGGGGRIKPTPTSSTASVTSRKVDDTDDWGLGDFATTASSSQTSLNQPKPRPAAPTSKLSNSSGKTLWDIDDFSTSASSALQQPNSKPDKIEDHFDSPEDDFDFGNREDSASAAQGYGGPNGAQRRTGLLDLDDDDRGDAFDDGPDTATGLLGHDEHEHDDDFLGVLAKPVEEVKRRHDSSAKVTRSASPATSFQASAGFSDSPSVPNRQTKPSASPPPHILGQIVEMGFSVDQARQALAKTSDGRDVQAALEMLLAGAATSSGSTSRPTPERRATDERAPDPPRQGPPKGFKERQRERMERARREREEPDSAPVLDVQEHADRLLSQATEIGQNVWSKASAFWKEGKEKVAKVYEERAAISTPPTDGRPKWMQESGASLEEQEEVRIPARPRPRPKPQTERFIDDESQHAPAPPEPEVDLFSNSTSQQPSVLATSRQRPSQPTRQRSQPTPVAARPKPPPPSTRDRPLPSISTSTLETASRHKSAGTDQFKLGQYGPAIESYTAAINALPNQHLLLIPLFTNRALARMRNGEYKGAVDDAGAALAIVIVVGGSAGDGGVQEFDPTTGGNLGPQVTATSWSLSVEPPQVHTASQQKSNSGGWHHQQGLGVDLVDGFVKALRRRAEGLEGREKWNDALKDWEVLSAVAWVPESVKTEAQRGAARCRKMTDSGGSSSGSAPPPRQSKPPPQRPKSKPIPTPASNEPSAALRSLQASTAQAEADDTLKHQLKDSVDSKLSAWRTGKEANIRALLSSLDLVLWEEILKGGVKVGGLHELVTPAQVKKGYVKIISRVHPDKLNAQNSTVEQRMLANGVFGTLNEAWINFQNGKQ